jgi:hypothetical protein
MKAAKHSSSSLPRLSREAWTPCWENLNKLEWCDGFGRVMVSISAFG